MCQIDDELTVNEGAQILIMESRFVESEMEELFKAYLDGLLSLPSETERIIREMEAEKRGER